MNNSRMGLSLLGQSPDPPPFEQRSKNGDAWPPARGKCPKSAQQGIPQPFQNRLRRVVLTVFSFDGKAVIDVFQILPAGCPEPPTSPTAGCVLSQQEAEIPGIVVALEAQSGALK